MFDFLAILNTTATLKSLTGRKNTTSYNENSKLLNYPVIWYRFRDVKGFDEKK